MTNPHEYKIVVNDNETFCLCHADTGKISVWLADERALFSHCCDNANEVMRLEAQTHAIIQFLEEKKP